MTKQEVRAGSRNWHRCRSSSVQRRMPCLPPKRSFRRNSHARNRAHHTSSDDGHHVWRKTLPESWWAGGVLNVEMAQTSLDADAQLAHDGRILRYSNLPRKKELLFRGSAWRVNTRMGFRLRPPPYPVVHWQGLHRISSQNVSAYSSDRRGRNRSNNRLEIYRSGRRCFGSRWWTDSRASRPESECRPDP